MKFRPLHDRVVVKRVAEEEKTKGGIIIPDTAKEKPMKAKAKSSPSARAPGMRRVRWSLPTSRLGTASCSASGPAPRSSSTASSI